MEDYLSEKEQIEKIRQWWSENGRFVIAGLVLGLSAIYGWRAWTERQENHRAEASTNFNQILAAAELGDRDLVEQIAGRLESDYGDTDYLLQAWLMLARMHMEADQPDDAAALLERVLARNEDAELEHIVTLRLARVRLYQQRAQQALDLLAAPDPGEFAPLYHELRGDALFAMGQQEGARAAYQQALEALDPARVERGFIEMKLNDLGPAAAEQNASTGTDADS